MQHMILKTSAELEAERDAILATIGDFEAFNTRARACQLSGEEEHARRRLQSISYLLNESH